MVVLPVNGSIFPFPVVVSLHGTNVELTSLTQELVVGDYPVRFVVPLLQGIFIELVLQQPSFLLKIIIDQLQVELRWPMNIFKSFSVKCLEIIHLIKNSLTLSANNLNETILPRLQPFHSLTFTFLLLFFEF